MVSMEEYKNLSGSLSQWEEFSKWVLWKNEKKINWVPFEMGGIFTCGSLRKIWKLKCIPFAMGGLFISGSYGKI
jgi:hypothetical protein